MSRHWRTLKNVLESGHLLPKFKNYNLTFILIINVVVIIIPRQSRVYDCRRYARDDEKTCENRETSGRNFKSEALNGRVR